MCFFSVQIYQFSGLILLVRYQNSITNSESLIVYHYSDTIVYQLISPIVKIILASLSLSLIN